MLQPFRFGKLLITAPTYFPACSHGSTRTNDGLISPSSSARFRWPSLALILTAAAAFDSVVFTNRMIARRLRHVEPAPSRPAAGQDLKGGCRTRRHSSAGRGDHRDPLYVGHSRLCPSASQPPAASSSRQP